MQKTKQMLVAVTALVQVSQAQECSCMPNSPKFAEECAQTTRSLIPDCVGDGKCYHGPADDEICNEEAQEYYLYKDPGMDAPCVDFDSLQIFIDPKCEMPLKGAALEAFKNERPKSFAVQGCHEEKFGDAVIYMGTACSQDSIQMAAFMDPTCATQVPDAPTQDLKFTAGYLDCFTPDGGKTYISAYQNGWFTVEGEVFPIRMQISDDKSDGFKDEGTEFPDKKEEEKFDDFKDPEFPDKMDLDKMDLDKMDFDKMDLDNLDLDKMDLDKMDLDKMDLDKLDLDKMDFDKMDLSKEDMDKMKDFMDENKDKWPEDMDMDKFEDFKDDAMDKLPEDMDKDKFEDFKNTTMDPEFPDKKDMDKLDDFKDDVMDPEPPVDKPDGFDHTDTKDDHDQPQDNTDSDNEMQGPHDSDGDEGMSMKIGTDGFSMEAKHQEKYGGQELTTEMKFDKYFMHGIDSLGTTDNSAPDCGPSTTDGSDPCMEEFGNSCCTHVVMTDEGQGTQTSFYRCMNQQIVDMSFSVQIDGMSMAMGCKGGFSSAKYLSGTVIASAVTMVTIALI